MWFEYDDESALCPVCRHMYPPPPHMTHVSSSSSYDTCFVPCVQTIEEIKGHRQKEILAMLPYLKGMYACMSVYLYIYIDA